MKVIHTYVRHDILRKRWEGTVTMRMELETDE